MVFHVGVEPTFNIRSYHILNYDGRISINMKPINIDKEFLTTNSTEKTIKEWADFFKCGRSTMNRLFNELKISSKKSIKHKHTEESKRKLSEIRKKYLEENPDKHPWRSKNKHQSIPCSKVKDFLKNMKISFIEEYQPNIDGRFFSIDIALPDKKIALEINGNQHYERDGSLKTYYQERHDLLEKNGWNVFEIHYSSCFNINKWTSFINTISNSSTVEEFDYFKYTPKEKYSDYDSCRCGQTKAKTSNVCSTCYKQHRKKKFPPKDELKKLLEEFSMRKIGSYYNVSDNSIRRWCKSYELI